MWAVETDDMASLRVLVDAGADVGVRVFGSTAIDMAREAGNQARGFILGFWGF
jgi:ankyrin repeat protein